MAFISLYVFSSSAPIVRMEFRNPCWINLKAVQCSFLWFFTLHLPECRQFLLMFCVHISFSITLFCPRDYRLCTPTPTGTDRFLQSPFWLFQHKRGVSEKTCQLFVGLLSPHKTAPAPGYLCWEHKVCCSHLHAGTIIISCLRIDQKLGCF